MPAKNKRIAVTASPEVERLVSEIAALSGQSKSSVVGDMLDMLAEPLGAMLAALRVVKESPLEAQRIMARMAAQVTGELAQAQLDLDSKIDARTVLGKRAKRARNATA